MLCMRWKSLRSTWHKKIGLGSGQKLVIEPTAEGEEDWTMKTVNKACALDGLTICTPSYRTKEGALSNVESPEGQLKMAKGSV